MKIKNFKDCELIIGGWLIVAKCVGSPNFMVTDVQYLIEDEITIPRFFFVIKPIDYTFDEKAYINI